MNNREKGFKKHCLPLTIVLILQITVMSGQNIHSTVPTSINPDHTYVFYLHGMIVQQQGANAVSEQYGPYEYQNIIETLAKLGYQVISEVRPKDSEIDSYGKKLSAEIDLLLDAGVPPNKITLIGASLGAYMTVEAAYNAKNSDINYVLLGMCSAYAFNYFADHTGELCGNFFSIYETSDGPGSCQPLLGDTTCKKGFKELALNMGNAHGFLYKPYEEWVKPVRSWIDEQ